MDNNNIRIHGKKWEKKLKEKERNRYDLFPFVVRIGFGCVSAAAAIVAAATIIYYSLFYHSEGAVVEINSKA